MFSPTSYSTIESYRQYAIWLITFLLVAFGFKYAKELIAFVLNKLYEFFIQNGMMNAQ